MDATAAHAPAPSTDAPGEIRATLRLSWPLVAAQLATVAISATDVLMIAWLGAEPLAASALSYALYFPALMFGVGVTVAAAPMIAQALGAGDLTSIRRTARQTLWIALGLGFLIALGFGASETIALGLGQTPETAARMAEYLDWARWLFPGALAFFAFRHLVSAHGHTGVVLVATLLGVGVNALGNYALIFGNFGFPALGLAGAGVATAIVHAAMALALLWFLAASPTYRRYDLFARFWRADWPRFWSILRLGTPIGLTLSAETGLFTATAMMIGWLGAAETAGHAVAIKLASIAFMAPLGLSQAGSIRVGLALGRSDLAGLRRAGWVSIGLSVGVMAASALLFVAAPDALIALFLRADAPENAAAARFAAEYLFVAALFQIVDGLQVAAAGALRGLSDVRRPMWIALAAYWGVGLPTSYALGFELGWEGVGVWLGLAAGLAVAAVALTWRFIALTRDLETARRAADAAREEG